MSESARLRIGVLAIQGAWAKHAEVLTTLGVDVREVRNADELTGLDGLIIGGGETTTMTKVMLIEGMLDAVAEFGHHHPVMGTCAGMVLMAESADDPRVRPFGWIPMTVLRNAYGSQLNSFRDTGKVNGIVGSDEIEMVFIRAPKFGELSDDVEAIGQCRGDTVIVRYRSHLAMAFHPELTDDNRVHQMWLAQVAAAKRAQPSQVPEVS